jgi:hypothetical protein
MELFVTDIRVLINFFPIVFLDGDHAEVYDEEQGTQEDLRAHVAPRKTSRHNAHGAQQGNVE